MLNDCVHRDKAYILALELADPAPVGWAGRAGAGASWPTGEPGDARGELARYDDLVGDLGPADTAADWSETVDTGLEDVERTVAEQVRLAVAQFGETARSTLADAWRRLDERQRDLDERLRALDSRTAAVSAAEKVVAEREAAVVEDRSLMDVERRRLDDAEAKFREETARVDELNSGGGDGKVRLDVGGRYHT